MEGSIDSVDSERSPTAYGFTILAMPPPQTLPSQPLGKDGPLVPSLGFGLMGLSVGYGQTP